jgi:hypothetical protein
VDLDRTTWLLGGAGIVAALAGAFVLLVGEGAASIAGFALLGVGGVLLVSLAFYLIGLSEDRERRGRR